MSVEDKKTTTTKMEKAMCADAVRELAEDVIAEGIESNDGVIIARIRTEGKDESDAALCLAAANTSTAEAAHLACVIATKMPPHLKIEIAKAAALTENEIAIAVLAGLLDEKDVVPILRKVADLRDSADEHEKEKKVLH